MNIEAIVTPADLAFLAERGVDVEFLTDMLQESGEAAVRRFIDEEYANAIEEQADERSSAETAEAQDAYHDYIDEQVRSLCVVYENAKWQIVKVTGRYSESRYIAVERDDRMLVVRVSDHDQPEGGSWRKSWTGAEGRVEADVCFKIPTFEAFCAGAREMVRTK
jgi:hypothetical protein